MKMNFGLDLVQTQKLILTKELKQSLEILQMSRVELEDIIHKEVQENPLLEAEEKNSVDWEKYIKKMDTYSKEERGTYYQEEDDEYNPENFIKAQVNLYDYLTDQISYLGFSKRDLKIALYLVNSIDENGYFQGDFEEISLELRTNKVHLEEILEKIQSVDPPGIGARSLEECLLLQLPEEDASDEVLRKIIIEDLRAVGEKRFRDLCKKYKITTEELSDYIEIIRSLEPKPGRLFSSETQNYVQPDVIVEKIGDEYVVISTKGGQPMLKINNLYKSILTQESEESVKDYVKEKLNGAMNLIKNIENRTNTVLKVANEIVKEQKDFFERGKKYLKPMVLRDIAERLEFHESTISRTVNGKYMMTPYGLFEFKYFFSSGLREDSGEDIASTSVKNMIKDIVEEENTKKPHSDQKICEILMDKGINISRRTVAKYREELQIPSSSRRKSI